MIPLSSLLPAIDAHWCIEERYAAGAIAELESIDLSIHQALYAARQSRRYQEDENDPGYVMRGKTALYSLTGPMTKAGSSWGGGTSTAALTKALYAGADDPAVLFGAVDCDSPGGQVNGTEELATAFAYFASKKPIIACVTGMCCSACLWAAAQCTAIVALPTAQIGSIGVKSEVSDTSAMYAMAGVKKHSISTGEYKGAGTPGTVIDAKHLANWQREVDDLNAEFLQAVAAGRNMTPDAVKEVADGRVFAGRQALALGLIDKIGTLDETLAALQAPGGWQKKSTVAPGKSGANPTTTTKTTTPDLQGKEKTKMRTTLAAALSKIGLTSMALAVMGAANDEPETMASEMAGKVGAEVDGKLAAHPLLKACAEAGITSAAHVGELKQKAAWGESYVAEKRDAAKKQAVVAFGVDSADGRASVEAANKMIDASAPDIVTAMTAQYTGIANAKGLQNKDGSAKNRQTAAAPLPTPADANVSGQGEGAAAWDALKTQNANLAKFGPQAKK